MKTKKFKVAVKPPVVDRLVYILPFGNDPGTDQARLMKRINHRIVELIEKGACERAYPRGGRYRENFRVKLNGGSAAFVQIGALQPGRQKGGIRIEVNPARFQDGDADQLNGIMRFIVGEEYLTLLTRPLLNNIDFAVDVVGVRLDDILVSYGHAQRYTTFGKRINSGGQIEGYNFGSVSSDYMTVAYDKGQERVHAAIRALIKNGARIESLNSNAIKKIERARSAPSIMRVEVRCNKLRGLRLSKLETLPNRFKRFCFCDLQCDGRPLPKLIQLSFLALCRQNGVKAALAAFEDSRWGPRVRTFWRSRQATWWQPELLWEEACEAVRAIGLFSAEVFELHD